MSKEQARRDQGTFGGTASEEAALFSRVLDRMDSEGAGKKERVFVGSGRQSRGTLTINVQELLYFIMSKLYIVVIGVVIGAIIMAIYAGFYNVPVYSATSKLYIVGQTNSEDITNLQIGLWLTDDYKEVFKAWEVHDLVKQQLDLNYSYEQLQDMVSVENPVNTRLLNITVKSTNAEEAADIANAYLIAAQKFIKSSMDTVEPIPFSNALVPTAPSSLSERDFVVIGALVGGMLAAFILVLIFLIDQRPKTPDDILRCAGLPTLGVVPVNYNLSDGKALRKKA